MNEEDSLRKSALECLDAWGQAKKEPTTAGLHGECSVLWTESDGTYQSCRGRDFQFPIFSEKPSVVSVKIMPVGNQSAAAAHVTVGASVAGWMVLLKTSGKWQCISAAFSHNTRGAVLPEDFRKVTDMTWNGYCAANRACDGVRMAQVFHATCRLTFVSDDDQVQIMDQPSFCDMVTHRYQQPPHSGYLQNDPRVAAYDSLVAVEFATPILAMVTLKVGHPPFLWTDYLTVARLESGRWWIVHKSSCHEALLLENEKRMDK